MADAPGAAFTQPMECLPVKVLPEGPDWIYEVKLDGYRAQAVKGQSRLHLLSRRGHSFNFQYPTVAKALDSLPADTVVDGEVVALDTSGRPDFNLLQNHKSMRSKLVFFAFDLLRLRGRSLTLVPFGERRRLLHETVVLSDDVQISESFQIGARRMLDLVKEHQLEGVVAKRLGSFYEPGRRTGSWVKYRVNMAQEFVIGGYTRGTVGFDSVVIGFYRGKDLIYCSRVRAGFVPATRRQVFAHLKPLPQQICPFTNLPQATAGRWGQGLTAEKMAACVWVEPEVVAQFEFLEWTSGDQLRHSKFVGLRPDKDPHEVVKEDARGA